MASDSQIHHYGKLLKLQHDYINILHIFHYTVTYLKYRLLSNKLFSLLAAAGDSSGQLATSQRESSRFSFVQPAVDAAHQE